MRRPCAVKRKMDMSCSCTIGNHSDGQRRRVSRVVEQLDVEHRGESTQTLCANAKCVDPVVDFEAQFFLFCRGPAGNDIVHVDRCH